jgi:hypothetical protein
LDFWEKFGNNLVLNQNMMNFVEVSTQLAKLASQVNSLGINHTWKVMQFTNKEEKNK